MKGRRWRLVGTSPENPNRRVVIPLKGGGVCWFTPENYPRIAEVAVDYPATYEEWRANSEAGIARVIAQKMPVPERLLVDVEKTIAWCMKHYGRVDGRALANYAAYLMEYGDSGQGIGNA